ncbi:peptidoglycan-binding domain-containing protein [Streptomyces sp. NBC_00162]|uniref:peptidoglycan-binding domain-containing protein n=1 Tax=Streptomyces sp. NBC_00162 TaxID=2903629 RepID=UPI00214D060C|nr:peptidoglycan-binding domain-containing protein [Streptomyces sp. NBC_00162]UUU43575.1 peptidoglycan-binding protein [Streptomyces sp. NBC_00162]
MSHDSDESAGIPDDHLLVRPYVAPSGGPSPATAPAWPQTGPLAFPGPATAPRGAAPAPVPAPAPASPGARRRGGGRGAAVATLLALAAAGGIVLLLNGPDPEPPARSERPPELSVPVLPARGADSGGEPGPGASARSGAPSAKASASASPGPSAGQGTKPAPSPSASAVRRAAPAATLRMGDSGPEVRALQELLFGQGFTYVSITGVYDGQTKRGVSQLQRDRGIKGDQPGVYGPATAAAFG